MGPHRDLVGEFAAVTRKAGLKFGVSSHDDRLLSWSLPAFGADKTGPKKGVPYDGNKTLADGKGQWWEGLDPADLYGKPPAQRTPQYIESVKRNWLDRHIERVDKYPLDMVWFDGVNFPYGDYGRKFAEHYFSASLRRDGRVDVVLGGKPYNLSPAGSKGWVQDYERGMAARIPDFARESITTPNTWFYRDTPHPRQDARTLAEMFTDVLSKNGIFILNHELRGNGAFPERLMPIYDGFGAWVKTNADAIYGTHAWKVRGDDFSNFRGTDEETDCTLGKVTAVRAIDGGATLRFSQTDDALTLTIPSSVKCGMPAVFELDGVVK